MAKELRIYMPQEVLFNEGDPSGGLYFIQSGKVEVFRSREETEVVFAVLGPGEVLGTLTVFNGDPRTASARATTKVELQYMDSDALSKGMDKIPVWAVAIIKDTVARLKNIDELYLRSVLNERRLIRERGGVLNHGAQLAAFYSVMMRHLTREEEGVKLFPIEGVSASAELVLNQRAEYLEGIFQSFVKGGLVKVFSDKKWGPVIRSPRPKVFEDFANFATQVAKHGEKGFAPAKVCKWMGSLVRVSKSLNVTEGVDVSAFIEAIGRDSGRTVGPEVLDVFVDHNMLRCQNNQVRYTPAVIQKRMIFEGTCRALQESMDDLSGEAPEEAA